MLMRISPKLQIASTDSSLPFALLDRRLARGERCLHKGRSGQAEDVRDSRRSHRQGINERIEREGEREKEDGHFQLLSLSASPPSVKREGEGLKSSPPV